MQTRSAFALAHWRIHGVSAMRGDQRDEFVNIGAASRDPLYRAACVCTRLDDRCAR